MRIGKLFNRDNDSHKSLTKEEAKEIVRGGLSTVDRYMVKTILDEKWMEDNLVGKEIRKIPSTVAFVNGVNEPDILVLVKILQSMKVTADGVITKCSVNSKLRKKLCTDIARSNDPIDAAAKVWEDNRESLDHSLVQVWKNSGGRGIATSVSSIHSANSQDKWPVKYFKDSKTEEFVGVLGGHAPDDCHILSIDPRNTTDYVGSMYKLATLVDKCREATSKELYPDLVGIGIDTDSVKHFNKLNTRLAWNFEENPFTPMKGIEHLAEKLLVEMLVAI